MKKTLLFIVALLSSLSLMIFPGCSSEDAADTAVTILEEASEYLENEEIYEEEAEYSESEIYEDGQYSDPYDVAEYIYTYGHLPSNYLTKDEAEDLGWVSSEGNLWDVAYGMSIGGDYFGNYEGLLPDGDYHECDVNYEGGFRGAERLIYSEDLSIYYTSDHYESFTQLY